MHDAGPEPAADARTIARFVLRVIAWGAALYLVWYAASPWITRPVLGGGRFLTESSAAIRSAAWIDTGPGASFVVKPADAVFLDRRIPADVIAEVAVNPLKYTFGLPFFLALLLASRPRSWPLKALAGAIVILAFASVGIACDVLVHVATATGPEDVPLFPMGAAAREAIAVGFQLGVLMFPTVVPILLWALFSRGRLVREERAASESELSRS